MNIPVELYTDGSCINNPGFGAAAFIVRYFEKQEDPTSQPIPKQFDGVVGFKSTTNNRMEILGIIIGLEDICKRIEAKEILNTSQINAYSDSKYVCDCINNRWILRWQSNGWVTSKFEAVKNKDLWERLMDIITKLNGMGVIMEINHIPGHQGYQYNEECDRMAVACARSNPQTIDEGYEKSKS